MIAHPCKHRWHAARESWTLRCDYCPQEQFRDDIRLALRDHDCPYCAAGNMAHIGIAFNRVAL